MKSIISSQARQRSGDERFATGSRRRLSSGRRRRRLAFDPLEARQLLSGTPPVAEFPLRTEGGIPEGAVEDPSGNLWTLLSTGTIDEINPSVGIIAQYQTPSYNPLGGTPTGAELGLITYNAVDGDIWFYESNANQFGQLNPSTGVITEYPALFFSADPVIMQIAAGSDGNIWFTEPDLNEVGMFNVKNGLISQFTMPLPDTQPQGIILGPDGNLWFTEGGLNQLGSLNPFTHVLNNYAYEPPSYPSTDQAEGLTNGPNGTIWFVERQGNQIDEFTIQSATFSQPIAPWVPPNTNPIPYMALWSIGEGSDGNIYYTEPAFNRMVQLQTSPVLGLQEEIPVDNNQLTPNLTTADVIPATTGSEVFVTDPTSDLLISVAIGAAAGTDGLNDFPFPDQPFPPATLANDANDVINVDGELWYTDTNDGLGAIEEFNPATQINTSFPLPVFPPTPSPPNPPQGPEEPNQMTVDANGNIWFTMTGVDSIGEFNPATDAIAQTVLTTAGSAGLASAPTAIAWDNVEQELWMTEPASNQIINFNPATSGSAVAPITIPDPVAVLVDPSNGFLFISEASADQIVEYSPISEKIINTYSTQDSPNQLIFGPDNNIWFTENNAVGILTPGTSPGSGGVVKEIPVSGPANYLSVGPSSGTYANTIWFTETGSNQIGEISVSGQSVVGYVTAPDSNAVAITLGPDGNEWFTSGAGTPAMMGAVVLNPADLGTQVVITSQPPNVEQTVFGGFNWGFGVIVAVENSAGELDPFVQQGTITIALDSNPGHDTLQGTTTLPVSDGVALFDGLLMAVPDAGYTIQATYSLGLNAPVSNPFYVAGQPAKLVATVEPPTTVQAGVGFGLTISAEDSNGLVDPAFDDPVQLAIDNNPPGDGVLNGTNPIGALYGSAAFAGLTIDQAGKGYTLQATDLSPGSLLTGVTIPVPGVTASFNVTAGPAVQLQFPAAGEPITSATAGQNFASPSNVVVDALDQFGSIDPTYNGPVSLALANNATGTFVGTLTVIAVSGVATFKNLAIDTAGTFKLEATSNTLTPATSTSITINPASAHGLVWAVEPPSKVTENIALGGTVDVVDQFGNLVPSGTQNISVALDLNGSPDISDLSGTTSVQASGGAATFSNLVIGTIGDPFTLVATGGGLVAATSTAIDVVAPQLVVTSQPTAQVTAGSGFALTVNADTYLGAVDPVVNGTAVLSIVSGPSGATIGGTASASLASGVATFSNVVLDAAGSYVLQVSSGNLIPGDTNTILVVAQTTAAGLTIIEEPPASVQAGAAFGFEVGAVDQFGNPTSLSGSVTAGISNNPGGSSLSGTTTVTASGGVATFSNLSLNKVGLDYTLVASLGNLTSVTTSGINVTPAAASQLVIPANGEPPSSVPAGQAFTMVVDAEDRFGNLQPSFTGSVVIALPTNIAGTTTVNAVGGVATFSDLMINTAGIYQIQATNVGLSSALSNSVTVNPSAEQPVQLVWAAEPPGSVFRNFPFGGTIDAEDAFGNLETGFTGSVTVAFKANPGSATLGGLTTVNASGGEATFSGLTINVAGNNYTLVATGSGLTSPVSTPIDVSLDPATTLQVATQPPSSVQAGQSFGLSVTALDQNGNPDPDFSGSVTVAVVGPAGTNTLGGTTTVTASDGIATFTGLTLQTVGSVNLQVTSTGLSSATTSSITVTAAPAAKLIAIAEPPGSEIAGTGFGFEVEAEDAFDNLATGFNGTVTAALSSNPESATLGGLVTAQASNGVAFFTGVTVNQAGTGYTIQATSTGVTGATTSAFSVTAAAASQLAISSQPPASLKAGAPFGFSVAVEDAFGNAATSFGGVVTIALDNEPSDGALNGTLTAPATNGVATFSGLSLDTAASGYTIQATGTGLSPATTNAIAVTPGAASKLVISILPPSTMVAGYGFGLAFEADDAFGNLATGFTGTLTISLANAPSGLPLTSSNGLLTVPAVGGVANSHDFYTLDTAGSYNIQASTPGLPTVTSGAVAVTAAPATQLVVVTEPPSSVTHGGSFGFVVAAEDQYRNIDPSFDGQIVVTAPAGSGAALGGTTTVAASNGEVSFTGLTLSNATTPVSLPVTGTGLTGTTTSPVSLVTAAQFEFAAGSVTVNENADTASFQVVRSGGLPGALSVNVATSGGTAVAGVNYTAINQVVSFPAGQNTETVTVPVKDAGVLASSLTVNVVLSSPAGGAVLGAPSVATLNILNVGQSTTAPPPVTMDLIQVIKKKGAVKEIVIGFSGALNAAEAASVAEYSLTLAGKKGSFTAKNAKTIKLLSAVYNPANDTVALTPKKKFVITKPVQLVVNGLAPSGLEDTYGRLIDGNDDGQPGSNAVALIKAKGATITSAVVDALLAHGDLARVSKARRK